MGKRQRFDKDGRRLVTAAICVLPTHSDTQHPNMAGLRQAQFDEDMILMVSSRRHEDQWVLPKGGWEDWEDQEQAALREVWEEAGVEGDVVMEIGSYSVDSSVITCFQVTITKVALSWPEQHERERRWCSFEEALEFGNKPWMRQALKDYSRLKNQSSTV